MSANHQTLGQSWKQTFLKWQCELTRLWSKSAHESLFKEQWLKDNHVPEHFDHFLDLYYLWQKNKNPMWVERGCYGNLAISPGAEILELSCGDGFNTKHFYSLRAKKVTAVDFDPAAIRHAKKHHATENIQYILADIRLELPEGKFDNIVWDGAIEHFTKLEMESILKRSVQALKPDGILSGYTIVERHDGKSLPQHECEFESKEDLASVLTPHFKNVTVFETLYEDRHNLYFWASQSHLPFMPNWKQAKTYSR